MAVLVSSSLSAAAEARVVLRVDMLELGVEDCSHK
jgi:hypothetical protein